MVEDFPGCLHEHGGRTYRACVDCGKELDISKGEWVAKHPAVTDRRGYQFSQLFSDYVDPAELLRKYRTARNLGNFYNLCLGLAYIKAENRISTEEVLSLCSDADFLNSSRTPCFMGIDQGTDPNVTVMRPHADHYAEVVYLSVLKDWENLNPLMHRFSVSRCVVDAMPELRNARAFAERFPGRVFLNFYNEHQKGAPKWDEKARTVAVNRTESLDTSGKLVQDRTLVLPRENNLLREFAKHLRNTAKRLEEDEETGSKKYVYLKLGADHFRHAFNYAVLAMGSFARSAFRDCDLS